MTTPENSFPYMFLGQSVRLAERLEGVDIPGGLLSYHLHHTKFAPANNLLLLKVIQVYSQATQLVDGASVWGKGNRNN